MTLVDYGLLDRSTHHYEKKGFRRVESPWLVSEAISDLTRPHFAAQYVVHKEGGNVDNDGKRKAFVASGEQSFLYLMTKGYLPPGYYQTITPCIRNEAFDETHVKYFVKNELIAVGHLDDPPSVRVEVTKLRTAAMSFFEGSLTPTGVEALGFVETDIGWDIEYHGIEIGSYGYRESDLFRWVYGTGLAEPRFSRIANMYGELRTWVTT